MVDSILETITGFITPSLTSRLAGINGESQSAVTKGLAATIPAVLGMVTSRAGDAGFMSQVHALATDPMNDTSLLDDPNRLVDRVASSTRNGGPFDAFRSMLAGANPAGFLGTIASYAGVKSTTASSIVSMAIPIVLGYLGKLIRRDGLDSAALGRRLAAENSTVSAAIPSALSGFISGDAKRAVAPGVRETEDYVTEAGYQAKQSLGWPWVAAGVAMALLLGIFALVGRERATHQAREIIGTSGAYATRVLPGGATVKIPAAGSEEKLLSYAETSTPLNRNAWIDFDRLTFDTNSSYVMPDSREQLSRISDILKAYPNVRLKIGGYTDNSGDPEANLKLSQDRATSVMNALVGMGISADRLQAEGYGEQYPVATNATEEGREQNRRVAFNVTAH
jgi:outer membrane protein OmpA-like peptidoglycan-associated protein